MKALCGVLVLGAAVWGQPASADPRGFDFLLLAQEQPGQAREGRPRDQRNLRRDERLEQGRNEQRRNERLTDEERRGLRRDIDRANRDIYRQHRNR